MPKILDHPLTLARERAGIGQRELAQLVGRDRSTIAAIEEARTQTPDGVTVQKIEEALRLAPGQLASQIALWRTQRAAQGPQLSPQARVVLEQSPFWVSEQRSFRSWREKISPSPTAFSSMLGVNRALVANYERGIRVDGMPAGLAHALMTVLGIDNDYLVALKRLPPMED